MIHQPVPHDPSEQNHTDDRVHIDEEKKQGTNVDELLYGDDESVENHVQAAASFIEQPDDAKDSEGSQKSHEAFQSNCA